MAQPESSRQWNSELHPRVPSGKGGGEFGKGSGSETAAKPKPAPAHPATHAPAKKAAKSAGALTSTYAYDAKKNRGPGYGEKGGDPHVHKIQEALNRLGLTDLHGKPLLNDGKLGPRTTQSIKAAQRRLGLKPDGQLTPALYKRLLAAKSLPRVATKPKPEPQRMQEPNDLARMAGSPPADTSAELPTPMPTQTAMSDEDCEQALQALLADMSDEEIYELAAATDQALSDPDGGN